MIKVRACIQYSIDHTVVISHVGIIGNLLYGSRYRLGFSLLYSRVVLRSGRRVVLVQEKLDNSDTILSVQ